MLGLTNNELIRFLLIAFFLLVGYFLLLYLILQKSDRRGSKVQLAGVLFVIYALICVPLVFIINQLGDTSFVLLTLLLLMSSIVLFILLYAMLQDFASINKRTLLIFILYLLVLSYITFFSRSEGHSRQIIINLPQIREAIRENSLAPMQHLLLNLVMFIPLGVLFPMLKEGLDKLLFVGPLGLMLSTIIESVQLFTQTGQCDLEDIISNTAGAVVGVLFYKVYKVLFLRYDDDDDDDALEDEEEEE